MQLEAQVQPTRTGRKGFALPETRGNDYAGSDPAKQNVELKYYFDRLCIEQENRLSAESLFT